MLQTTHKYTKTEDKLEQTQMFHCDVCFGKVLLSKQYRK